MGALLLCHVTLKTISGILLGAVMHRKSCIAMLFFFLFFSVDLAVERYAQFLVPASVLVPTSISASSVLVTGYKKLVVLSAQATFC